MIVKEFPFLGHEALHLKSPNGSGEKFVSIADHLTYSNTGEKTF